MALVNVQSLVERLNALAVVWNGNREHARRVILHAEPDSPEFYAAMQDLGYTSRTHHMTEDQARDQFNTIMNNQGLTDDQRYNLLYALDVRIQNNTDHGMASPVIREILAAQGEIVMREYKP